MVFIVQIIACNTAVALEFEPGVGAALEYTDNARLTQIDVVDDLMAVTYVGARISENDGSLAYQASTSFNKQNYTKDTFADQRYFYLDARADWAMIEDRFNWNMRDYFSQVPAIAVGSNTPNNLQNTNAFTFGADIKIPLSARQNFSIVPSYSQFYYEKLFTDNNQYSLAASWGYQAFRLTSLSLNLGARKINYTEKDLSGQSIEDTTFTNASITFSGTRQRSRFAANLGSTNAKRDNGQETTGFTGYLSWLAELSSRSTFDTLISTDLTDTSTVAVTPGGGGNGVQITADVIRRSLVNLAYAREDASFSTRISAQYSKVKYSDSPRDRLIRDFALEVGHPVTQLLSSGAYVRYNRNKQLQEDRLDEWYTVGGNLNYSFSRKLKGLFDVKYRQKESTVAIENYSEFSVYVSMVYGFGTVTRPTRAGGF